MPRAKKPAAISVKELSVSLEGNRILQDVTFEVKPGTIAAVIGPNGSGKTTLIKSLLGLTPHQSGVIKILGQDLHEVRNAVGYVPQRFAFEKTFPITVHEFLGLANHTHASPDNIEEKIKEVGLVPTILSERLGNLSGGQLQRVLIAQAILNDPTILVLDEPSTGIDVAGEQQFYDVLKHLNDEHDTTILLVSHDISMVLRRVDQVICLNRELLCVGPPKKALTEKTIKKLFSERDLIEHNARAHKHHH